MTTTPNVPDLQALLERVEAASGPDRYVDCWVACTLDGYVPSLREWPARDGTLWRVDFCRYKDGGLVSPGQGGDQMVSKYTASLDSAMALAERVLPGWELELTSEHRDDETVWRVTLGDPLRGMDGAAPTPAVALVIAILKAMIATQGEKT